MTSHCFWVRVVLREMPCPYLFLPSVCCVEELVELRLIIPVWCQFDTKSAASVVPSSYIAITIAET
jgi:hypothetical protein